MCAPLVIQKRLLPQCCCCTACYAQAHAPEPTAEASHAWPLSGSWLPLSAEHVSNSRYTSMEIEGVMWLVFAGQ
jgi:hypothetical protein